MQRKKVAKLKKRLAIQDAGFLRNLENQDDVFLRRQDGLRRNGMTGVRQSEEQFAATADGVLTSGVPFFTPGSVPAACLPTRRESGRQDAGKPQGPSGPIGMGEDTAASNTTTEHVDLGFIGAFDDAEYMSLISSMGASPGPYRRERRAASSESCHTSARMMLLMLTRPHSA